jgi:glycerophosphoryl diester phosphodiesterase
LCTRTGGTGHRIRHNQDDPARIVRNASKFLPARVLPGRWFATAAAAVSRWRTLDGNPPLVIAHRGASGLRPEHTIAGYALGLAQGADVIEPDLVPSADGVLYCRHEPALGQSTDIASRPAFSQRCRDGDWQSFDLHAHELDGLRAMQPFPGRASTHDGQFPVPRFSALIAWAAQAAAERGAKVVLYPEIKHPTQLAAAGHDPLPMFIKAVREIPAGVEVRVQCFEAGPLRRMHDATGLACTLLLDADADWRQEIAAHRGWLAALGVNKQLLWRDGHDSGLRGAVHAAGVRVDAWTYRDDRPAASAASVEDELRQAMQLGVDGLFCDFPATGVAVRARLLHERGA